MARALTHRRRRQSCRKAIRLTDARMLASCPSHARAIHASITELKRYLRCATGLSHGAAARCSRDGAVHFVCMDWRHMDSVSAVGTSVYGELLNLWIWNKSNAGMGSLYRSKHELVFVYRVGAAHLISTWSNSASTAAIGPMSGIMPR